MIHLECFICDTPIYDGQHAYSFSTEIETFEDCAYSVYEAEGILSTCVDCAIRFNIHHSIDMAVRRVLKPAESSCESEVKLEVTMIDDTHFCSCCGKSIEPGARMFVGVHSDDIWEKDGVTPTNIIPAFRICLSCSDTLDARNKVQKVVNEVNDVKRNEYMHNSDKM